VVRGIPDFFAKLPGRIMHGLAALPGLYIAFWRFILERGAYLVGFTLGKIVRFFIDLPGRVVRGVSSLAGRLSAFWNGVKVRSVLLAKALVDGTVSWFRQLPGRAAVAVQSLPGKIRGAMAGAGTWLIQAGRDVVHGLISGITGMAGAVVDEAKRIGSNIVGGFKSAMGIGSPSRVMADEVGRWIPAGIAVGITRGMPVLAGAAGAVRSKLLGALDPRTRIRWGEVSAAKWDQLLAAGWRGNPNDKMEALYAPTAEPQVLQPIQLVVDGKVLQEVLLKVKRNNRGLSLGLA
jgi:hypothetical protein